MISTWELVSHVIKINSFSVPLSFVSPWQKQASLTACSSPVAKVHIYICNGNISEPLLALHRLFIARWWYNHYLFTLIFLVNVTSEVQHRGLAVPWLNQFIKISRESNPPVQTSQMFCFHLIRQLIWPPVPQERKDALTIYFYTKGWQGDRLGRV